MKKTGYLLALSIILISSLMFSCGGGGGGVDNTMGDSSFTIGYNANGAESGTAPRVQTGDNPSSLSIQANTGNLVKNGYLFDGWNTKADGSGTDYTPGSPYRGKNITLYAKWARLFNYNVNAISPAPSLDGTQRTPAVPSATITGLTARGQTLSNIDIPESIDGYPVSSIGDNAFQDCSNISDVTIPDTVTSIGDNAFAGCVGITSVTIPESVTAIGGSAFSGCAGLTTVVILSVTPPAMEADTFSGCVSLTVTVPSASVGTYSATEGWNAVTIVAPGSFSVSYNDNGADSGTEPLRQIGITGISIYIYGNAGNLACGESLFNGWNTKADGSGISFAQNDPYAGPDNLVLYAQWLHPDYTVTFDSQGANKEASPKTIKVVAPANTIGELPSTQPAWDGYRFGGWYTLPDGGGKPFVVGSPVTGNMTVYAKWTLNQTYTVKFDSNGADVAASPTSKDIVAPAITVGELPTAPKKNGYYFSGWFTGAGTEFTASTVVGSNITVYAKWTLNPTYTVKFDSNGADVSASPTTKDVVAPAVTVSGLPTEPKKNGYYFDGWFTGAGVEFTASTVVGSNMTVYAKWTLNPTYIVKFDSNSADVAASPTTKDVVAPAVTVDELPTPPKKNGYYFGGWFTSAGTEFTTNTLVSSNMTVYAKWNLNPTYTVIFDSQEADTPADPESKEIIAPKTTVEQLPTPPIRAGYSFGGWWTGKNGGGTQFHADTIVDANTTVYAKWTLNPTYTVTFNSNEATTLASPTSKNVVAPAVTVSELPTPPKRNGYYFSGWFTGTGAEFTTSTVVNSNMTVYAKWALNPTYTVTFDSQEADTPADPESKEIIAPKTTVEQLPTPPIRAGYSFGGWWTGKNGGGTQFHADTIVDANTTVYAKWTRIPTFSVTYYENGADGGIVPLSQVGITGISIQIYGNTGSLTRAGCTFKDWNTKPDGTGNSFAPDATYAGPNDIILYAQWTHPDYIVTFNSQGANIQASPSTIKVIAPANTIDQLPSSNPTKTGYDFGGWWTEENGRGKQFTSGSPVVSSMTVYAKWTPQTYQITYNDQGGSAFSGVHGDNYPTSHTYNSTTELVSPTKKGWLFGGWYADSACTGPELAQIASVAYSSDITLYAKWNPYEYTVTFDTGILPGSCYINSFQRNKVIETKLVESPCLCVESLPPDPEVSGVFFAGWYTGLNGSGDLFTSLTEVTDNITIHARWVYYSYTKQVQTGIEITGLTSGCNASKIEIPEYINGIPVISIGENAFYKKTSITSVKLGNGIKTIGRCAFYECENLTEINLPNSLTNINDFAFSGCAKLKGISLPKNLINLGYCSFQNCKNIKDICLPGCLNTNHSSIFANSGLTNVTIEEGVKTIPACMFYGCRINSIEIPSTVTAIKERAFDSCALVTVRVRAAIPPSIDSYIFTNCNSLKNIYVPFDSITIYKGANYWKKYADIIKGYNE